jgi:hypothetical protein
VHFAFAERAGRRGPAPEIPRWLVPAGFYEASMHQHAWGIKRRVLPCRRQPADTASFAVAQWIESFDVVRLLKAFQNSGNRYRFKKSIPLCGNVFG